MRNKNILLVFLLSIFISFNYLTLISSQLSDFQEALEHRASSGIPIYLSTVQIWTFDITSLLFDALIIAIAVGLVGYYIKDINIYIVLLFGLFLRYSTLLFLIPIMYIKGRFQPNDFSDFFNFLDLRQCILLTLQIPITMVFSYLGYNIGKYSTYLDSGDKDNFYLYGLPKKIWVLIIISFIPVAKFLSKLTIINIYGLTNKITSIKYWKDTISIRNLLSDDSVSGISGLLGHFLIIIIAWLIAISIYSFGINSLRNKNVKLRYLRIILVFIIFPISFSAIEIIRNKTWFF